MSIDNHAIVLNICGFDQKLEKVMETILKGLSSQNISQNRQVFDN